MWVEMVKLATKLDERGRVTIPAAIRDQLGIGGETEVLVDITQRGTVEILVQGRVEQDPLWKTLEKPAEISPDVARRIDIERMREEVWAGEFR